MATTLQPGEFCGSVAKIFKQFDGELHFVDLPPFHAAGCVLPKMGSHLHSSESLLEKSALGASDAGEKVNISI